MQAVRASQEKGESEGTKQRLGACFDRPWNPMFLSRLAV
jgi:hypothetical protein